MGEIKFNIKEGNMCISNDLVTSTLKRIRAFENKEDSFEEQVQALASIKIIMDELDLASKKIKKVVKEDIDGICYLPGLERKVFLSDGKKSNSYDKENILGHLGMERFLEVSSIIKKELEEEELKDISEFITVDTGAPYITVAKMNKKELVEETENLFKKVE